MSKYDYRYLASLIKAGQAGDSEALSELYTATYQTQYAYLYEHTADAQSAAALLQEVYRTAFLTLGELKDPKLLDFWLEQIAHMKCSAMMPELVIPSSEHNLSEHESFSSTTAGSDSAAPKESRPLTLSSVYDMNTDKTSSPHLSHEDADRILQAALSSCDLSPNIIPVKKLELWANYRQHRFLGGKIVCIICLLILAALPLAFVHPSITIQQISSDNLNPSELNTTIPGSDAESTKDYTSTNVFSTSAQYRIEIRHILPILPIRSVAATLNDTVLDLTKAASGEYTLTADSNGTLSVTATSINGQSSTASYEITLIDTGRPKLERYYTEDDLLYLVLADAYSGVDYDHITAKDDNGLAVEPVSLDTTTSTIAYTMPTGKIFVTVPDNAGNCIYLTLSVDAASADTP